MASQNYNAAHMDILYNVTSHFHSYDDGLSGEPTLPKWDVIPYIGVGIMWSSIHPGGLSEYYDTPKINHPFSIAYGVQMRYRVAQRLHLTAEIGGISTFQSFDGWGKASRFGDNIFSASAGISVTIGKTGWRKAVDASALTYENDIL